MKPPFAYFGGKTTLAPRIAALLPPHEHYVEPFAGSLAVLLAKMRSDDEHRELAEALQDCRAAVVLSGYDSPLYDELFQDWHSTRISTTTGQGGARQGRTEVLWSNRAPAADLFAGGAA
jgi:site-specific DNA-adenine methylase